METNEAKQQKISKHRPDKEEKSRCRTPDLLAHDEKLSGEFHV